MDRTIHNNAELFEELVSILSRHRDEPGVTETLEYLKAAKTNYVQRSIDHMMNCLVLTLYELARHPPGEELSRELRSAIQGYVTWIFDASRRMKQLADEYEASGGKLLTREEVLQEVRERRGGVAER